ncbi:hypothetical protein PMM47T1_15683 [Pseudomonas sp. M47T1]|uniref:DUF1127 domain-containing protein n=1 Tax=Pseudomonas sp. M47T1 TaxID=1179778 RepID=UPI0002607B50|nr:hypothetical protein PMM47T1_15683 [Pseudomonas sp. M47T1]
MKGQKGYVVVLRTPSHAVSFKAVWQRLVGRVRRWRQLAWERHQLALMSDDMLKDIGMSRADVSREVERHFWDDPLKK